MTLELSLFGAWKEMEQHERRCEVGVDTGCLCGSAWGGGFAVGEGQGELWLERRTRAGAGPGRDRHQASVDGLPGAGPSVRDSVCLISHVFVDLAPWSLITYVVPALPSVYPGGE